ncbi:MAG: sucrose synthase, partial [Cyanobacteriota bacterium]
MIHLIQDVLDSDEKSDLRQFASQLRASDKKYLLRNDILSAFSEYCTSHKKPDYFYQTSHLGQLVYYTQEIMLEGESLYLIIRPKIASQDVYRIFEDLTVEPISVEELLDLRDRFVNHHHPTEGDVLELDFQPFYDYSPTIRDPKNIGKGVRFLNRYL